MPVVRDVIVLVAVRQGLMLMTSLLPRHARSPLSAASIHTIDRTLTDGLAQTETKAAFRLGIASSPDPDLIYPD